MGIYTRIPEISPAETATTAVKNAFRLRYDKAYLLIALNVEKDLQVHISSVINPLEAWKILQKQFEFVSVTQIVRINRKFYAASMKEDADLMQHLTQEATFNRGRHQARGGSRGASAGRGGRFPNFNRPFAGSSHMVRNKLHWDANDAVGLSKQRKVGLDW